MIKTTIEQVKLVSETLKKAPDSPPPAAPQPAVDMKVAREANSKKLTDMFSKMNEHSAADRGKEAHELKGQIKDFALKAPKGSIDIGHMGMMRENQIKVTHPEERFQRRYKGRPLRNDDMEEIINHHLGDAKSLKDIHQNHGGDNTIKTLMHTMGAYGEPKAYSTLKFNKPGVHEDLLDMVNPGKSDYDRANQRHKGVLQLPYMNKTPWDQDLHDEVERTYRSMTDSYDDPDGLGFDDPDRAKAHEKAVVARGLEQFKRHYKL